MDGIGRTPPISLLRAMNDFMNSTQSNEQGFRESISAIRLRILDAFHLTFSIYVPIALLISLGRAFVTGWTFGYTIYIIAVAAVDIAYFARRSLSYEFRAWLIIVVGLVFATVGILNFGLLASGHIYFVAAPIFTVLFLGTRAAWKVVLIVILLITAVSTAYHLGLVTLTVDPDVYVASPWVWVDRGIEVLLVTILITAAYAQFHAALERLLQAQSIKEHELAESEYLFRTIVQNTQAIVFILDRDGVFLLSDGLALSKLGLKPGQVVGLSALELYKDNAGVIDSLTKALNGELHRTITVVNGVVFDTFFSPYKDDQGRVGGVIGIATDVTEREEFEEAQRQFERRIEAQQQVFYRETILSVTEGKLSIADETDVDNYIKSALVHIDVDDVSQIRDARALVERFLQDHGMDRERLESFILGVGEAITNAVKHGKHGCVYAGEGDGELWVGVVDRGPGISSLLLPKAVLMRGFSTKTSMGLGYSIMLDVSDGILLHTSELGTSVVLTKQLTWPSVTVSLQDLPDTW